MSPTAAFLWVALLASLAGAAFSDDVLTAPPAAAPQPELSSTSVRKESIAGGLAHSRGQWLKISGKVRVVNGYTIAFEDGTTVALEEGPELEQLGKIGDAFYPAGREAAKFLTNLIGGRTVTMYVNADTPEYRRGQLRPGLCFAGDTNLGVELIANGWAIADHSLHVPAELLAREKKLGLWRGEFVSPKLWRKGERLPDEVAAAQNQTAPSEDVAGKSSRPATVKELIPDDLHHADERVMRITGKAVALDGGTLLFEDGTKVNVAGGAEAPGLEQRMQVGDAFLRCGIEARNFLQKLIGDQPVAFYRFGDGNGRPGQILNGQCFVGETNLGIEMVRNGWAISNHSGMAPYETIARENQRGLWRGRFVIPRDWRKGERLPGEAGDRPGDADSVRRALGALQVFDPIVQRDESDPAAPVIAVHFRANAPKASDEDLLHLKAFPALRSIAVSSNPITDAGLELLAGFPGLEELSVNWTGISVEALTRIVGSRTTWKRLEFGGIILHDDDLSMLTRLAGLQSLSLRGTLVTDAGVRHLAGLTSLRDLSLMSTAVGDAGLAHLAGLTNLEDLDLDRTAITDAGLRHLAGLTKLRRLQVAHTAVTDAGLRHLQGLASLKSLNLRGTKVSPDAIAKLRQQIPELQVGGP